ncbi:P-loop containing nucleoside triphosphate hydrolase protein [Aspergillus nidulans var. acristatus]
MDGSTITDGPNPVQKDGNEAGEREQEVLKAQLAGASVWLSPARFVLSCMSVFDGFVLAVSTVAAIVGGVVTPLAMILVGRMGQSFRGYFVGETDSQSFDAQIRETSLLYVYLGCIEFIAVYIATVGFGMCGERITQRIREKYLAAVLSQNVAYFEVIGVGEITARITADTNLIQDAITGKASLTLSTIATFVAAFIINFTQSWRLALILLPAFVAIVGSMSIGASYMVKYTKRSLAAYNPGASIAEEAISSVETVIAYCMQGALIRRYDRHLAAVQNAGVMSGIALAVMIAIMNAVIFWTYGLAFWEGSRLLVRDHATLSNILTILFSTITGAFALGNTAPHTQAFVSGLAAAEKISQTVSRKCPFADATASAGERPSEVVGRVELRDIKHIYPSRPEVVVLDKVNLTFPEKKMTAIVGPSGCGKSTIVGLLERFYTPVGGTIYIDGHDISQLNLAWLRQQIGLVSQEPTLFSTSVFENIRFGLVGTSLERSPPEQIERLVIDAARIANAYEFVTALPDGFQTHVGDSGSLLSGGQKQRIAIARAIIRDPKILLLDEATSALDVKSERMVQEALTNASKGRTTIVIAHRLSTIRAADNIVVMADGQVIEQGTHNELLSKQSTYYDLVQKQCINVEKEDTVATPNDLTPAWTEKELIFSKVEKASQDGSHVAHPSDDLSEPATPEQGEYSTGSLVRFVAQLAPNEKLTILGGLLFSIIAGAGNPTQSVFFAEMVVSLSRKPDAYDSLRKDVNFWSWMYLMIGFTALIGWLGQGICFAYYSQRLTRRARRQTLDTILHQDVGFFALPQSSPGILMTTLSASTTHLAGISGVTLGTIFIILTTLIGGFTLSVAVGWKLALVCSCTIPVQLGCGLLRLKTLAVLESNARKAYESSAVYACEASAAIRTVASLTLEKHIQKDYHDILTKQRRNSLLSIMQSAVLYAASLSFNLFCSALGFWYGGREVATDHYSLFQFFVCYTAIIAGSFSAGAIFSFAPDMGKAKTAARDIKALMDRPISIDPRRRVDSVPSTAVEGHIQLLDVVFRYPTRPDHVVLKNVSLSIRPGQYVALVGASGSGKSTIVALLERFFDPQSGRVLVDHRDVRTLDVITYRDSLSLVSQTPTLYEGTIRDNIIMGACEGADQMSDEDIVRVCKEANIYDFIISLPKGFSTVVGARGTMLSGGQKQRIAIARALLRNPKILLLDEATSALDADSEKVVQAALDKASRGRTTVAVAHRISTVQNADVIYVLENGQIVEQGNHHSLMELKGRYHELVQLQSVDRIGD